MKRIVMSAVFVALVFNLVGCPPDKEDTAALRLSNYSSVTITTLNISPEHASTWGANQLSQSVPPGYYRDITNIPPGYYDLRAVASTGQAATQFGVYFAAGDHKQWSIYEGKGSDLYDELTLSSVEINAY